MMFNSLPHFWPETLIQSPKETLWVESGKLCFLFWEAVCEYLQPPSSSWLPIVRSDIICLYGQIFIFMQRSFTQRKCSKPPWEEAQVSRAFEDSLEYSPFVFGGLSVPVKLLHNISITMLLKNKPQNQKTQRFSELKAVLEVILYCQEQICSSHIQGQNNRLSLCHTAQHVCQVQCGNRA